MCSKTTDCKAEDVEFKARVVLMTHKLHVGVDRGQNAAYSPWATFHAVTESILISTRSPLQWLYPIIVVLKLRTNEVSYQPC